MVRADAMIQSAITGSDNSSAPDAKLISSVGPAGKGRVDGKRSKNSEGARAVTSAVADNAKARRSRGAALAHGAESIVHLAYIGRAQFEAQRRVDFDRIEVVAADEFDAGDHRLGRANVFLNERDAIDGVFESVAGEVRCERIDALEEFDAQPLAGAVVLGDERRAHAAGGRDHGIAPDRGDGARGADAVVGERCVLRDLAHFELECAAVVDDAPPVSLQPGEDAGSQFGSVTVTARVR